MIFIKTFILLLIFFFFLICAKIIFEKFSYRVDELKDMKNGLNMFLTKIKFTYESVPYSFEEIGNNINGNIGRIFNNASIKMKSQTAGTAWVEALEEGNSNLKEEDLEILKKLGRELGKTDIEGQISEIKLIQDFLGTQIELAEEERKKNEKLYKTLGGVIGLAIGIILI